MILKVSYEHETKNNDGDLKIASCGGILMTKAEWDEKKKKLSKIQGFKEISVIEFKRKPRVEIEGEN